MNNKMHRLSVSEVNLVVRHLKLEEVDPQNIQAAINEIDQIYGLDGVSFEEKSMVITLAYDATKTSIETIEEILANHNIEISHGWWTHFKESYYKFIDENVKENASHEPWSCHKDIPRK